MYFKQLEISGFKSFADKTILQFPKPAKNCPLIKSTSGQSPLFGSQCGISGIVGPNGSGKSNLVDSIRWALGEQSLKSLRGKKTEDVIFTGSDIRSRLNLAEVSLCFDNEDKVIPVDYPEVVITRRLYRSGDAEYLINKKPVRLQDIVMLAAKANFGQKSYSIVSQGTIDSFLSATLSERKDFFDEAAGVKQYQIKRDSSINKLRGSWENLKQAKIVINEIEPVLHSLTRQVNKLEKKEKIQSELILNQKKFYFLSWQNLDSQTKKYSPRLEALQKETDTKKQTLEKIQLELNAIEKQDSRTEQFNSLQQNYQKLVEQKNELSRQQIILESKIELARQRKTFAPKILPTAEIISQLKKIDGLTDKFLNQVDKINNLGQLPDLKILIKEITAKTKELILQLENPKKTETKDDSETQDLLKKLETLTLDLKAAEQKVISAQKSIAVFNAAQDRQKDQFFNLQRRFQSEQNEFYKSANKLNELKIEIAKIETRREDLNYEISQELGGLDWIKEFIVSGQLNETFLQSEIQRLKRQLELIGGIDPEVTKDYKKTKERYEFLVKQSADLTATIADLKKIIAELDKTIQKQFDQSFHKINTEFQKYFKTIFSGGKANLILIKESDLSKPVEKKDKEAPNSAAPETPVLNLAENKLNDELSQTDEEIKKIIKSKHDTIYGIDIEACPPGKKLKSVSMLSGGEKALVSIALICAVISSNPSPFVILDEVDAALDEANSERFAAILDELAHKTQFIVITHNRSTMHQANVLYGVTISDDGVSKLLSLHLQEAEMASQ